MQAICIVSECRAVARHTIRTSKRPNLTFEACTYHASGVFVQVSNVYRGKVSMCTSFSLAQPVDHLEIGSLQGRHELAG